MKKPRTQEIALEFQPYITKPPVSADRAHRQACSNDAHTINHWRDTWLSQIKTNKETYGSFAAKSIGKLHGSMCLRPCIVAGSGPSLKHQVGKLKDRPKDVGLISCLHNFHFMEDNDANVDYYVTLDAGPVTIEEIYEGGSKSPEEYWKKTEGKTLVAYIGTHPELLSKWRGEIYFFNAPVPDDKFRKDVKEIENFNLWLESGGNVLGSCMMFAKGFLNSQVTIFVGADFSFSNEVNKQFHSWKSKYDATMGECVSAVDVFGNRVLTWPSYNNFKLWFEVAAQRLPGQYINCTEGGTLGAHRDGNIISVKQMWYDDMIDMYSLAKHKYKQATEPEGDHNQVLI